MNIDLALTLLLSLLGKTTEISALIAKARGEGRDISDEEWSALLASSDAARERLAKAIAAAGKAP